MSINVKGVKAMKISNTNWKKVLDGIDEIVEVLTKLDVKTFTTRKDICGVNDTLDQLDQVVSSDELVDTAFEFPIPNGFMDEIITKTSRILTLVNNIDNNVDCVQEGCNPPQKCKPIKGVTK